MIIRFRPQPQELQRLEVGPIGPHIRSFADLIAKQNYSCGTGWVKLRLVARFSRWLQRHRITLKELDEVKIQKFLSDRRTRNGKRNYAIFLLLARLGLRAGEVVALTLDDIDWRAGELKVRGKGARVDRLPLLEDAGPALADYLQNARPESSSRHIFIQCKAPFQRFAGPGCVRNLVRQALLRLGVPTSRRGAHVLRHSLATGMLRNGATLAQIGQVLRHQLPQTTEIYAKVYFSALRALALPWIGGAR